MIIRLQEKTDNRTLFILNCILLSITHFCKLSYYCIKKYVNNDQAFFNEYIKRYNSFIESAIYLNDQIVYQVTRKSTAQELYNALANAF